MFHGCIVAWLYAPTVSTAIETIIMAVYVLPVFGMLGSYRFVSFTRPIIKLKYRLQFYKISRKVLQIISPSGGAVLLDVSDCEIVTRKDSRIDYQ